MTLNVQLLRKNNCHLKWFRYNTEIKIFCNLNEYIGQLIVQMTKFLRNIRSLMTLNDCYFYYAYIPGLNGFKLLSKEDTHFFLLFDHFINLFYSITNRNNAVDKLLYVTSMYLFKRQLVEGCRYISHHYISQAQIQDLFPGGGGGEWAFSQNRNLFFF